MENKNVRTCTLSIYLHGQFNVGLCLGLVVLK